jgi:hypothetical protein
LRVTQPLATGIIACNAAPARFSVAAMASCSPCTASTSTASFSTRRSRSTRSRLRLACSSDAASIAACLTVWLPMTPRFHRTKSRAPCDISDWLRGHRLEPASRDVPPQLSKMSCPARPPTGKPRKPHTLRRTRGGSVSRLDGSRRRWR